MAEIVQFPGRGHSPQLTKRQLANHLQRSDTVGGAHDP
jgi:hypothetical protein